MVLGGADETPALFGFGVDSFIEVILGRHLAHDSASGTIRAKPGFLRAAITAYYWWCLLHFDGRFDIDGCLSTWCSNIDRRQPCGDCRFLGVHVVRVVVDSPQDPGWNGLELSGDFGRRSCSKACVYLSIVLLVEASAGYELTGIGSPTPRRAIDCLVHGKKVERLCQGLRVGLHLLLQRSPAIRN